MLIYFANIIGLILLHYFFYKKKISTLETYCWIFTTFYLSVFIGLRYEVGGDWSIYLNFFDEYNQLFNINLKGVKTRVKIPLNTLPTASKPSVVAVMLL